MDKVIVRIDAGLGKQHIAVYKDSECKYQEAVLMNDLIDYLIYTCYKEDCYNVHFMGNWQFIQGLVEELSTEEVTKYNTNKILIEVN